MRLAASSESASAPSVTVDWWRRRMSEVREYAESKSSKVLIFDPQSLFCDDIECFAVKDGITFYRDRDHMSLSGARLIVNALKGELTK